MRLHCGTNTSAVSFLVRRVSEFGCGSAGVVSRSSCTINFCVWPTSIQLTPWGTAFFKKLAIILFVEPDVHLLVYKGHTFMIYDNQPQ